MKRLHIHHLWLVLAAYGVWFAVFSGVEEIMNGKYWKAVTSLVLGMATYYVVEKYLEKK